MQDQTRKLKAIRRLFGQFPEVGGPANETLEQRSERLALKAAGYLTALDGFDMDLIDAGIDLVLRGELPGHDGRFVPTAPMMATACRLAAEQQARKRYLAGIKAPRLPARDVQKTPEQRERGREMVARAVEAIGAADAHHAFEATQSAKDRWAKTNAHFDPPQDEESLAERLRLKRGYDVGSPESDEASA